MPTTQTLNTITVPSGYAVMINATSNNPLTLFNKTGSGTFYYGSERLVSSSSNEGSVAVEASTTITQPTWVISASTSYVEVQQRIPQSAVDTGSNVPGFFVGNWNPNTAESGTDTTPAEKKLFTGSLFLPVNKKIKGIGYLVGSVGGTNKVVAGLFDSTGTLLAHTSETTEGATVGTAKEVQELELTTPYSALGPGLYYVGITMNGGTARIRTIPSNTIGSNVYSKEITISAKNTLANITAPTAVEQGKAPVAWVY
jgi:hypothetical protein